MLQLVLSGSACLIPIHSTFLEPWLHSHEVFVPFQLEENSSAPDVYSSRLLRLHNQVTIDGRKSSMTRAAQMPKLLCDVLYLRER